MQLRGYQRAATDAAKDFLRQSIEPALIDAAPAAGKSFCVAEMARWFHEVSGGKRVLCLQPNAKLCHQNVEKFRMTGERCSIFSASAGAKSTRQPIVYATPGTVKNSISRFKEGYCAVIIDEAHSMAPTIVSIIEAMRESNPNLRVLGLTGTPYRMLRGYIFRIWPDGKVNTDETARDPFFVKMVYQVTAQEMLDQGFITRMKMVAVNDESIYDVSGVQILPNGTLNHGTVEQAFEGHGRKTSMAVRDVMAQVSHLGVKGGVMLFAATQRHAQEILASLPPENSALSTGDHGILKGIEASDNRIVEAYRNREVRYLVSVNKYSIGFDVDHTEFLALMRYSESPDLTVQILGRAWRLHENKPVSYVADYCGNLDRHFPDGNIYAPVIKASGGGGGHGIVPSTCPDCGHHNDFSAHKDYVDFAKNEHGYCLDAFGEVLQSEWGPVPGHYGRRCWGQLKVGREYVRCGYYWTSKPCPACEEPNDIAARYCRKCKAEIIDPNERLISEFKAMKRDPHQPQTDIVLSMDAKETISTRGNKTLRVDWVTPHRQFSCWFNPEANFAKARAEYERFLAATRDGPPATVSYVKERESGFYRILAYGMPADELEVAA